MIHIPANWTVTRSTVKAAMFAATFSLWAGEVTRLAVPPNDFVTLEMISGAKEGCGEARLDFRRLFPDGTSSPEVFRIPEGRLLLVTDVDWHYSSGAPGLVQILALIVENRTDQAKRHTSFESTIRLGSDGVGGTSEHLTTGFVISSSARICIELRNGPIGSPLRLSKVLLRGYLIDVE